MQAEHELSALREKTEPHTRMVNELTIQKREISGQMAALESELRTCKNETAELRQEMLVKAETAAVLSAQIEAIQKKGTVVSHSDMERYRLLENDLAKISSRYSDLEKSLDAHNELLAEEGKKSVNMRDEMARLVTKEVDYKSTIERLEAELRESNKARQDLIAEAAFNRSKPKTRRLRTLQRPTRDLADTILTAQNDKTIKKTLGRLFSEKRDIEDEAKNEKRKRKQLEQHVQMLSTKINFLVIENSESKCKYARLQTSKEFMAKQLKAQRAQNLTLHKRLGELFDTHSATPQQSPKSEIEFVKSARDILERAVFEWHVKSSLEGDNSEQINGSKFNAKRLPTFEARFFSENDVRTSSMLMAAREGNMWDIVVSDSSSKRGASLVHRAEDMMHRFQMKQFMQSAQKLRDPDRAWFSIAEKFAFVMTTALALELEAGHMCSEIRIALADLASKFTVMKVEFNKAAERFEAERMAKHKSIMKYTQESFRAGAAGEEGGSDDEDKTPIGITLRLADSQLDDETLHGVASLIMTNDKSTQDDWRGPDEDNVAATVEAIVLRDNFLGDASTASLQDFLSKSQSLKMIDLRGNAMTSTGIAHLKQAALTNKCIERIETRNEGGVLVCHKDVEIAFDHDPIIIDCRHNDPTKQDDKAQYLNPNALELLLENLDELKLKYSNAAAKKLAGGANGSSRRFGGGKTRRGKAGLDRSRSRTFGRSIKGRGVKEEGGFGSDFIDYALTAPPAHMPLVKTSAFLTQSADVLVGKESGTSRANGRRKRGGVSDEDGGDDSVALSAAAASDAPPGERELGNLLDKKIRLMERRAKTKKMGERRKESGGTQRRWASSSSSSRLRPQSAGFTGRIGAMSSSSGIRRPPKSTLRPKSAVLRRLPFAKRG